MPEDDAPPLPVLERLRQSILYELHRIKTCHRLAPFPGTMPLDRVPPTTALALGLDQPTLGQSPVDAL